MAARLFEAMQGHSPRVDGHGLCRLDPLSHKGPIVEITFSGGVSEYIYGREVGSFGDLGVLLAQEIRLRVESWGPKVERSNEGIRATVVGASQYTTQVSGSTIFVSPMDALPLRNVPVIAPTLPIEGEKIDSAAVAAAIKGVLKRLDLGTGDTPVAVFVPWTGSATFQRLDAFCKGAVEGLADVLKRGHPIVLAGDGDVGGLLGIHLREEMKIDNAIVSVDGLELKDFDYIDIGSMLPTSGAVPVVIKSLIFPTTAAVGQEWQPAPRAIGEAAVAG
jgi:ethanolamine utilization protein EutA